MDDIKTIDLTSHIPESKDPEYLAWAKSKIQKSLNDSKDNPKRYSQAEMMEQFQVER